jgi:hypothetical protein
LFKCVYLRADDGETYQGTLNLVRSRLQNIFFVPVRENAMSTEKRSFELLVLDFYLLSDFMYA